MALYNYKGEIIAPGSTQGPIRRALGLGEKHVNNSTVVQRNMPVTCGINTLIKGNLL